MFIILKHTLKNIFCKPFRTLLLLFCIAVCSLSAMLCFDMSGTVRNVITSFYGVLAGNADLMASSERDFGAGAFADAGAQELLYVETQGCTMDKRNAQLYSYVTRKDITILGMDTETARKMRLLPEAVAGAGHAFISSILSEEFCIYEGDTITLHNLNNQPVEFVVQKVLPSTGLLTAGYSVVLSEEGMNRIRLSDAPGYSLVYMDFSADVDVPEAAKQLKEEYPYAEFLEATGGEELEQAIASITNVFFALFAICALMVIFITISLSQRITSERMSVVGTLRSLGVSRRVTTAVLLLEHGLYGLAGSIAGVALYSCIREPLLGSMFIVDADGMDVTMDLGRTRAVVYIAVITAAVLVEILCPIKEVIKAVNTPIRDIIFESRDTAYTFSKAGTISGLLMLLIAGITAFMTKSYAAQLISLAAFVISAALLFPYVLKGCSWILEKVFSKLSMPVARMASILMIGKKSTVGSATLLITASSLAIVIYILASSLSGIYQADNYDCDIIIDNMTGKGSMYNFIGEMEEVAETECIYMCNNLCLLGNVEKNINVFGYDGYTMFSGISGLPESLADDACYMDEFVAEQLGLRIGDVIAVTFDADSFLTLKKELRLAGYCNSINYDGVGESIVISKKLYLEIYKDYPAKMLVKLDYPEHADAAGQEAITAETVENIKTYAVGSMMEVMTKAAVYEKQVQESQGVNTILYMLIVLGVGLSLIGTVSNQLIGFDGRKRECAVLNSVAMSRQAITKMLLSETMFSIGITLLCAIPAAGVLLRSATLLLKNLTLNMPVSIQWAQIGGFTGILLLLFTLTAWFPARALKRMNVAMQLKYE